MIARGEYVFATKYDDGDPADHWGIGFYKEARAHGTEVRHYVEDGQGRLLRANGFRRVRAGIRTDVARWLLDNHEVLERSPPGAVNLWGMLGDSAFTGSSVPVHPTSDEPET